MRPHATWPVPVSDVPPEHTCSRGGHWHVSASTCVCIYQSICTGFCDAANCINWSAKMWILVFLLRVQASVHILI